MILSFSGLLEEDSLLVEARLVAVRSSGMAEKSSDAAGAQNDFWVPLLLSGLEATALRTWSSEKFSVFIAWNDMVLEGSANMEDKIEALVAFGPISFVWGLNLLPPVSDNGAAKEERRAAWEGMPFCSG